LVRAIAGADPISSGAVHVAGKPVHLNGPAAAIRAGVVLVPEDRKAQGVVLEQTIGENLAFGNFDHVAPKGWVFPKAVQKFAEAGISRLGVKGK
ncbi:sugar ABC transporter ATP-binding protein, partial [Mesorhizobium sp. M2E.F.Ca.ET.166.01.1.1]